MTIHPDRKISKLEEKLIEVPEAFLNDASAKFRKLFAYQILYNLTSFQNLIAGEDMSSYSEEEQDIEREVDSAAATLVSTIKKEYKDEDISSFFNIYKVVGELMASQMTLPFEFDLRKYDSRYGDLSEKGRELNIYFSPALSGNDQNAVGGFAPGSRSIYIYPLILPFALEEFFEKRMGLGSDRLLVFLEDKDAHPIFNFLNPSGKETTPSLEWAIYVLDDLEGFLDAAIRKLRSTLEHEFVHLLQGDFFNKFKKPRDGDYTSRDVGKYLVDEEERNPLIATSLEDYIVELKKKNDKPSPKNFKDFIRDYRYFNALKKEDEEAYRKAVNSFYALVKERLPKEE